MQRKKKFVDEFCKVTQSSSDVALQYFESSRGSVHKAINEFFLSPEPQSSAKPDGSLFANYADADNAEQMGPKGIENFCHDIGIEPVDPEILVFAYYCGAQTMGLLTRAEFDKGIKEMGIDAESIAGIKAAVPEMSSILADQRKCKAIYLFLFDFARDSRLKSISLIEAVDYWELLLPRHFALFEEWSQFCRTVTARQVVNRDLWMTLWDFAILAKPGLVDYDFAGAWPVMIDEFAAWYKGRHKVPPTPDM